MNHITLLDMATDLGYELAMSGAETFRVEESISRVLAAYGIQAEVFAIPNYLIVSILTEDGTPITRMRRIGQHGNDLDAVEKYSALSRAYVNRRPEPEEGVQWLDIVRARLPQLHHRRIRQRSRHRLLLPQRTHPERVHRTGHPRSLVEE